MSGKSNGWDQAVLAAVFQGVFSGAGSTIFQNAASPATNLYMSLHTADPGPGGNQTTSEAAYTGYARVAVARSTGGWTLTGETITPVATIVWPTATGGSETETFWGIGLSSTGTGTLLYSGPISPTIAVTSTITPELTTLSTVVEA
jgi:hypothetical protein